MPAAIKIAETAMRIGDPNLPRLNGERLAEVPVDAVPISLAVRAVVTEGLLRACCRSLSKLMEVIGSCVDRGRYEILLASCPRLDATVWRVGVGASDVAERRIAQAIAAAA